VTTVRACTRHQSLWNDDKPLFFDKNGYALISEMAATTSAFAEARAGHPRLRRADDQQLPPTGAGYEAPINLVYSQRNRSACVRIRRTPTAPKRVAWSSARSDPSCTHTCISAMLMAAWTV